jgi:circadian clock protein KaiC
MSESSLERLSTGIDGLDEILCGGLVRGRNYLVRGEPGSGKTILGNHFLVAGADAGETALCITLEESTADAKANAAQLGFDLDAIHWLDLSPDSGFFVDDQSYDVFAPSEVEGDSFTETIIDRVDAVDPDRVFVDPLSRLRYLAPDDYQFHKQVLAFMRYLGERGATVCYTAQDTPSSPDADIQFLSDGIVELGRADDRRTISVPKFRGSDRKGGDHAMRITGEGIEVFPKLVPDEHSEVFDTEPIPSGTLGFDSLLNGGIERGTVTVISGPTGVGKTTTGSLFVTEAAKREERASVYLFEETEATYRHRCESIGLPVDDLSDGAHLGVEQIESLERSPEEFAQMVRHEVERNGTQVVMLDGISGYQIAIQGEESDLVRELHALCRYLKNVGVTVILVDEVSAMTGDMRPTEAGISYLADNVMFMRYMEIDGELRKLVGVLKKRVSEFEHTMREFEITSQGVQVGDPLHGLRGILDGNPERDDGAGPGN